MNEHDRIVAVIDATLAVPAPHVPELDETLVAATVAAMQTPEALASVARDPYWPKWDTPWWQMALLDEAGLTDRVPLPVAEALLASAKRYLAVFPLRLEEVPPGIDTHRDIVCHCALATLDRMLRNRGVDIDRTLPWVRGWYAKYALPDGGWNCDESTYTKPTPHSSFMSTVPMLEALANRPELAGDEGLVLDRGARYLIERRLFWSLSKNAVAHPEFLETTFPRYYDYDILRGLAFLVRWARQRGAKLPAAAIVEAVETLARAAGPGGALAPARRGWHGEKTLEPQADGTWTKGHPARYFPLLEEAGRTDRPSAALTRSWRGTLEALRPVLGA